MESKDKSIQDVLASDDFSWGTLPNPHTKPKKKYIDYLAFIIIGASAGGVVMALSALLQPVGCFA